MGLRCKTCGRALIGIGPIAVCSNPDGHAWVPSDAYTRALREAIDLCPKAVEPRGGHVAGCHGESTSCLRCGQHLSGPAYVPTVFAAGQIHESPDPLDDIAAGQVDPFVEPVALLRGFTPNRELAARVASEVSASMALRERCLPMAGHFDPSSMSLSLEIGNRSLGAMDVGGPGEVWRGSVGTRQVVSLRGFGAQRLALWWLLTGEVPSVGEGNLIEGLET